ncbi:cupin domain-containing protein [Pseudomonas aeruginosa]|uniref:cupin domain-containing protein n=1 Tax=Pseudomonas aeruginosa TaxID=287 RepID=UPI0021F16991|nr:cupin domain-containing protein [Pseudomonas aeruginosa]MCV6454935.1 cupin domain-containing protein [Pseudomonas aeruginosa]
MSKVNIDSVVSFVRSKIEPTIETVNYPGVLSGEYKQKTWNFYNDTSRDFTAGVWEAESCREVLTTTEQNEFCHIISGVVRLTDSDGNSQDYEPGDSFIIPVGFEGVWENVGTVKKLYVLS